jgi:LysR substrate binding domain.
MIGKTDEELLGMARRGEADVTFVQLPMTDSDFEHAALLEDEYVLVMPPARATVRRRRRWMSSRRCR